MVGSPSFEAGQQARQKALPHGGQPISSGGQDRAAAARVLGLDALVRVPGFPDPNSRGHITVSVDRGSSPLFRSTQTALRTYAPVGGP